MSSCWIFSAAKSLRQDNRLASAHGALVSVHGSVTSTTCGAMACTQHVVDDVLTYIWCHHVRRSTPRDALCSTIELWPAFTTEKLKAARDTLVALLPDDRSRGKISPQRKTGEKLRRLLVGDVIDIFDNASFVELDPRPIFVCADITCLPPSSPKESDLAFILKKLGDLSDRVAVTECSQKDVLDRVAIVEATCMPEARCPADMHRKWAQTAAAPPVATATTKATTNMVGGSRPGPGNSVVSKALSSVRTEHGRCTQVAAHAVTEDRPFITVGRNGRPVQPQKSVQQRPRRKDVVRGTGTTAGGRLTAAPPPPAQLFLSGCSTDVTAEMVQQHVLETCDVTLIKCEAVGKSVNVASFLVVCPEDKKATLMAPEVWPQHCSIRKYYTRRDQPSHGGGSETGGLQEQSGGRFSLINDAQAEHPLVRQGNAENELGDTGEPSLPSGAEATTA